MLTTAGQLLLNEALPADLHTWAPLDKGGVSKLLKEVGERYPHRYGEIVNRIKDMGNHAAYMTGTSFTLRDLAPMTGLRDAAFKAHERELHAVRLEAVNNAELHGDPDYLRRKALVLAKIEGHVNEAVKESVRKAPNGLTGWVASGARGDVSMARQMTAMAGLNVDVTNRLVSEISKRSFSEGLSPIDFHVHALGARRGVVNTYTSVREPGAFAKELNTISADMVITRPDCGTRRGRTLSALSADILDRCLAEDVPGVGHRNDVITSHLQDLMRRQHVATVLARSPLTCEAIEGVCSRCYGLNEDGRMPPVGEHVGLKAAQGITEPLTQLALNTKHTGGVVGAGKSPFQQIMQVMHAPKNFTGAAVLAQRAGTVQAVAAAPSGGHHVTVGGVQHYVGPDLALKVKKGDSVARGDVLSTGQPHPVEVVEHKGMAHGRAYFADTVKGLYADAGIRGHGKVFETISRAVLNLGQVIDPGHHDFAPGEIVHWNAVAPHVDKAQIDSLSLHQAEGRILSQDAGPFQSYQVLTPRALTELKSHGVSQVQVFGRNQLVVKPMMLGTERAALHKGDWMANLGFRFVNQSFKENAATAASASIHGWNPVGAYAYGAEFGKGAGGRY